MGERGGVGIGGEGSEEKKRGRREKGGVAGSERQGMRRGERGEKKERGEGGVVNSVSLSVSNSVLCI